jgi:hypothetical protein
MLDFGFVIHPFHHVAPFVALSAAAVTACVWSSGNPEIVAPNVEGKVFAAPASPPPPITWSARMASSPERRAQLESLREAARAHRLASPPLREAEATACAGLPEEDVDVSPFFYSQDIVDVQPLRASDSAQPGAIEGAVVTFRRVEGLTAPRLQRLLDCQTARDAALGYLAPEMTWCPLAVPGVLAHVTLAERGLDVRLASGDHDAAAETYERAVALPLHPFQPRRP